MGFDLARGAVGARIRILNAAEAGCYRHALFVEGRSAGVRVAAGLRSGNARAARENRGRGNSSCFLVE